MIMIILVIGISLGLLAFSFNGNDEPNISESTKNYVYIPSDMTKANPNFVMEYTESSWITTNIADVKDEVVYTLQGTVLSIGDPIEWKTGTFSEYGEGDDYYQEEQIMGFIPITISVDNVYKGKLTDETFTFYSGTHVINEKYYISSEGAHFEIGENILINLGNSDRGPFSDGHYYPVLSQFGKYQLQPVVSAFTFDTETADIEYIAFNVHHPNGIPLDQIARLALP